MFRLRHVEEVVSMGSKSFAAAINCMDGRTQIPVIDYVKRRFRVDHVDMITEPRPIRILAEQKGEIIGIWIDEHWTAHQIK